MGDLCSETSEAYLATIDRTFERLLKDADIAFVRRDVIETIKRKWASCLNQPSSSQDSTSKKDSNPASVVNRAKYLTHPAKVNASPTGVATESKPTVVVDEEAEYADEFDDSEFVHATEVGQKLAATFSSVVAPPMPVVPRRNVAEPKKKELVNVEELDGSELEDSEYEGIPEVTDCEVRVFGQTEVCESVVGPRRVDSRWIVTVMNGFVRTKNGDEILFRTAKQTLPHFHHHSVRD